MKGVTACVALINDVFEGNDEGEGDDDIELAVSASVALRERG